MGRIYKQEPFLVSKVWGGERLAYKDQNQTKPIGESWEVSVLPEGESSFQGQKLSELLAKEHELKILVKIIDTSDNLSIQVHPDDELAAKLENSSGKTECWYILDAEPGAKIYLGLKDSVTKEQLKNEIESNGKVNELLCEFAAKSGQFYFVPAGQIHAIGSGITLLEVQQSSGITYRLWDWNRVGLDGKPRELHIKKGLQALKKIKAHISEVSNESQEIELIKNDMFTVKLFQFNEAGTIQIKSSFYTAALTCLAGKVLLQDDPNMVRLESWESTVITSEPEQLVDVEVHEDTKFILAIQN